MLQMDKLKRIITPVSKFIATMESYMSQTESDIANLDQALKEGDRESIFTYSHRIKGGAQILSAVRLTNSCFSLEDQAFTLTFEEIEEFHKNIHVEWENVRNSIIKSLQEIT